ncbi:MAG: MarR family transcriptional regulator [Candidatus Kapabacteria bacterium]|nr:MarR family transcriptional regulator [Ignavibacteriota bacterium]MCW5885073.1 MarR family transcriptional regulator [Candidatus Kapabacteria bacterium]
MEINEIINLLRKWSDFKLSNKESDLYDFGRWLTDNSDTQPNHIVVPILKTGKVLTDEYSGEVQFLASYFITRMNKFIKIYTKEIFNEYGLTGGDDFSFLALIDKMDRPNKKELCLANLTEITTGMDIIKKLVKLGYTEEIADDYDKRAKRLIITEKGRFTANAVYSRLNRLREDVLGDLTGDERTVIIRFLERLNTYHTNYIMSR